MMPLFDLAPVAKWKGSLELVVASSLVCAWCGPTYDITYNQPALFKHGGYGATEGRRVRGCRCGAIRVLSLYTLNPRMDA